MDAIYFRIRYKGQKNFWLNVYLVKQFMKNELKLNYLGTKDIEDVLYEEAYKRLYD